MNILERIRKQYFDYMKEYGVYPNAVLLGRQDFQSLRSYVNVTCKTTKAVSVYTRPRVLGMLIFEATKENIITGGNCIYHNILMGVTRKFAQEELEKVSEGFTRYKFKLQKVLRL